MLTAFGITENVIGPIIDQLKGFKTTLGDKMPDLSSLGSTADGLMKKFAGDSAIMDVIKPVLEKLKALVQ